MIELSARKQNGARVQWVEEVPLSSESAVHAVAPPVEDDGAVTLLRARVLFENEEGRTLRASGLSGRFLVASGGVYADSQQRFSAFIYEGTFTDPHDGLDIDEEAP